MTLHGTTPRILRVPHWAARLLLVSLYTTTDRAKARNSLLVYATRDDRPWGGERRYALTPLSLINSVVAWRRRHGRPVRYVGVDVRGTSYERYLLVGGYANVIRVSVSDDGTSGEV